VNGAVLRCFGCTLSGVAPSAGTKLIAAVGEVWLTKTGQRPELSSRFGLLRFRSLGGRLTGIDRLVSDCLHHIIKHGHVNGIVIGRAPKITFPRGGFIANGYAQSATNALINSNGTDYTPVCIGFFNYALFNRTRSLTYGTRERTKTTFRVDYSNLPRITFARRILKFRPHNARVL
jgi:hypothetical protein